MRHAEAEDGPQLDPTRGLTDTGKKQAKMMGKWLSRQLEKPDLVIESNMRRSHQTAKRVAEQIGAPIVRTFAIDPDGKPETAIKAMMRLGKEASARAVIAVSHGPLVEEILAWLTQGTLQKFHFAHGSVAHFDDKRRLHWLVSPNTVARDEDEMDAVTEAAIRISRACVGIVESLQHPRHADALAAPRQRLKRIMVKRMRKQRAQVLKAPGLHAWMRMNLFEHPREADAELRARLQAAVEAHINGTGVFQSEPDERDSAAYDRIVTQTMNAAAQRMVIDYQITVAREKGQQAVAEYLANRGFTKLAADIDATTRDRMVSALTDVFESGGTYADAVKAIEGGIVDEDRADMIARTELNDAYNQSMLASAREIPGALKEWSPDGEACEEICIPNVEQGPIPLDEDFDSGDDAPPAHPRCDCSISFVLPSA